MSERQIEVRAEIARLGSRNHDLICEYMGSTMDKHSALAIMNEIRENNARLRLLREEQYQINKKKLIEMEGS